MGLSRLVIVLVVACLSFVLPGAICLLLASVTLMSVWQLAVTCLAGAAWIALLLLVNWWEFTSIHLRWVWAAVFISVALYRVRAGLALPSGSPFDAASVVAAAVAAPALWAVVSALVARRPRAETIALSFPLTGRRFLVTDGGDGARSFLVNYHYGFGQHRAAGVNASMRYALDVVEVGPAGVECRGFVPRRNDAYRIWGCPVHAPCEGRVVRLVNDIADNDAFGANRPYGLGNHVVIRMRGGVYVVLGHLLRGSVAVALGQEVRAGDGIGRAGNSGWTERPHLHMQAMRSADGDWWHGEPVPLTFDGRFLVRNQTISA